MSAKREAKINVSTLPPPQKTSQGLVPSGTVALGGGGGGFGTMRVNF